MRTGLAEASAGLGAEERAGGEAMMTPQTEHMDIWSKMLARSRWLRESALALQRLKWRMRAESVSVYYRSEVEMLTVCVSYREREREREKGRGRETETERDRKRETERERERILGIYLHFEFFALEFLLKNLLW